MITRQIKNGPRLVTEGLTTTTIRESMMADCQHTCRICAAWTNTDAMRQRFSKHVAKDASCWNWTGHRTTKGYGQFNVGGVPDYAHRVSVRLDGRTIPDGMQVDHLCRNTSCVRPSHLDVVSHAENTRRRDVRRTGRSGVPGITWHEGRQRWRVYIESGQSRRRIGEFRDLTDAIEAQEEARADRRPHTIGDTIREHHAGDTTAWLAALLQLPVEHVRDKLEQAKQPQAVR